MLDMLRRAHPNVLPSFVERLARPGEELMQDRQRPDDFPTRNFETYKAV